MRRKLIFMIVWLGMVTVACQEETSQPPISVETEVFLQATFHIPRKLKWQAPADEMHYLIWLPEGYGEKPDEIWPMIFYLHGAGAGENGSITQMSMGLPLAIYLDEQPDDFPFIV